MKQKILQVLRGRTVSLILEGLVGSLAFLILGSLTPLPIIGVGTFLNFYTLRVTLFLVFLLILSLFSFGLKRTKVRLAILILAGLAFVSSAAITWSNLSLAHKENVSIDYGQLILGEGKLTHNPDVEIDAYTHFDGRDYGLSIWKSAQTEKLSPIIVFIHGGGWVEGERLDRGSMKYFSNEGFMAVTISYPLSDKDNAYWQDQEYIASKAILWLRDNAHLYGGDANNIFLTGESAGGNLAINIATRINDGTFSKLNNEDYPIIRAISPLFPGVNLEDIYVDADPLLKQRMKRLAYHVGGDPIQYPERISAIDNSKVYSDKTPPTLMIYGSRDHFVPYYSTQKLVSKMDEIGGNYHIIEIPYQEHGLDAPGSIGAQIYRQTTVDWFRKFVVTSLN